MKRTLLILLAVLLVAGFFLVALAVAPAQVEQAWRAAGLPPSGIQKLASLLPGQVVTGLPEPAASPTRSLSLARWRPRKPRLHPRSPGR